MSLLLLGLASLGNDIDVYMQPLIEELKVLGYNGIKTFDESKNEVFAMHEALLWTISDFRAYAMLSSWSTKGELACPHYNEHTMCWWL